MKQLEITAQEAFERTKNVTCTSIHLKYLGRPVQELGNSPAATDYFTVQTTDGKTMVVFSPSYVKPFSADRPHKKRERPRKVAPMCSGNPKQHIHLQ